MSQVGLRHGAAVLIVGTGVIFGAATTAQASTTCAASAASVSWFGGPPMEPIAAESGAGCGPDEGVLNAAALGVLDVGMIEAVTHGGAGGGEAVGRVASLRLGADAVSSTLTASLLGGAHDLTPAAQSHVDALIAPGGALHTALTPLRTLGLELVGSDGSSLLLGMQTNLPGALQVSLPDVLSAGMIEARAAATCSSGQAVLTGASTITDLRIAGLTVDPEGAAEQVLSLDTASLQLGQLLSVQEILQGVRVRATMLSPLALVIGTSEQSLYDLLVNPGGLLGAVDGLLAPLSSSLGTLVTTVDGVLQPLLTSTDVALPPGLLRATVTPRSESANGAALTHSAATISVTALGQPVVEGELATARATTAGLDCTPVVPPVSDPPGGPVRDLDRRVPIGQSPSNPELYGTRAAELALQCEGTKVRLIDVRRSGARTLVRGYAERPLAGQRVAIRLRHGGRTVGRTTIRDDGTFALRVALPPRQIRHTSKARYYAVVEGQRTRALKFQRRLSVLEARASGGRVTFSGHLSAPRPKPARAVRIQERVSCSEYRTVATVKPNAAGRFTVSFPAPADGSMAVYRAVGQAPTSAPSRRLHPTYTLPRIVLLGS